VFDINQGAGGTQIMSITAAGDTSFSGNASIGGFLNLGTPTELTIASGVVTATRSYHTIDTEADAASDDLDTINGGTAGDRLVITSTNATRSVVVKDGTGNLQIEGDFTMNNPQDTMELIYNGTNWLELSRSNNA
jgi:hypothetical protein